MQNELDILWNTLHTDVTTESLVLIDIISALIDIVKVHEYKITQLQKTFKKNDINIEGLPNLITISNFKGEKPNEN